MQTSTFDGSPSAPRHACVQSQGDPEAGRIDSETGSSRWPRRAALDSSGDTDDCTAGIEPAADEVGSPRRGSKPSPTACYPIAAEMPLSKVSTTWDGSSRFLGLRRAACKKPQKRACAGGEFFCRIFGIFPITPKLRTHNERVLSKTPTLGDFDKIFDVSKSGGVAHGCPSLSSERSPRTVLSLKGPQGEQFCRTIKYYV